MAHAFAKRAEFRGTLCWVCSMLNKRAHSSLWMKACYQDRFHMQYFLRISLSNGSFNIFLFCFSKLAFHLYSTFHLVVFILKYSLLTFLNLLNCLILEWQIGKFERWLFKKFRYSHLMSFFSWKYVEWQINWIIKANPLVVIHFTNKETKAQRCEFIGL